MRRVLLIILTLVIAGVLIIILIGTAQPPAISADVIDLKSLNDDAGFARAERPRSFSFPLDHGPHPEYQTEWWYYTGNLDTTDGRHFGYQLTFFRRAIAPSPSPGTADDIPRVSDWTTNQVYFAHFAISDVKNNRHSSIERFSRGAAGLAGATGNPFRVWLEDWSVDSVQAPALPLDGSVVRLRAEDSGRAIDLTLTADKPPVLEGDAGLSPKSAQMGNASYYYSLTRLATSGTLNVDGETLTVKGLSWMDHEFGTTALGPDAVGWDWFSIQLSDGREVMFFQIRNKDGSIEPLSGGTLVEPDGTARHLTRDLVTLQVLETWTSPSGGKYPARWNLVIPSEKTELMIKPYIADQEMRVSIIYWEGAVQVDGHSNGAPVRGSGYVELTGYAKPAQLPR